MYHNFWLGSKTWLFFKVYVVSGLFPRKSASKYKWSLIKCWAHIILKSCPFIFVAVLPGAICMPVNLIKWTTGNTWLWLTVTHQCSSAPSWSSRFSSTFILPCSHHFRKNVLSPVTLWNNYNQSTVILSSWFNHCSYSPTTVKLQRQPKNYRRNSETGLKRWLTGGVTAPTYPPKSHALRILPLQFNSFKWAVTGSEKSAKSWFTGRC